MRMTTSFRSDGVSSSELRQKLSFIVTCRRSGAPSSRTLYSFSSVMSVTCRLTLLRILLSSSSSSSSLAVTVASRYSSSSSSSTSLIFPSGSSVLRSVVASRLTISVPASLSCCVRLLSLSSPASEAVAALGFESG